MSAITCAGLSKRYGDHVVLDNVDLSADPGQVVGIAGPNGAGKTTLFEILAGGQRADSGSVRLDGTRIDRLPAHRRSRMGLARTFQSPLVPNALTVHEVLTSASLAHGADTRDQADLAQKLVGLSAAGSMLSGELDALSRRRLLLACLVMRRPRVLLLDEPCSGLLDEEIGEVEALIRRLVSETDVAVLVIEHRLELLRAVADEVHVLHQGRWVASGQASDVFASPVVRDVYFGDVGEAA